MIGLAIALLLLPTTPPGEPWARGSRNPILPLHEYIPDAEPRVINGRLYLYGSHDRAGSDRFCDTILRVWSAPIDDLTDWHDHGVSFSSKAVEGNRDDVPWTDNELYAPDVVEHRGRYYLFAYLVGAPLAVAVSDDPGGPFKLVSQIKAPAGSPPDFGGWGQYIDPGVLVEGDRVHLYWGYLRSHYAELNPDTMTDILPGTYRADIIPKEAPFNFFEACSPRKIGNLYYLVYADGGILVYATAARPEGPFRYGGPIIRNGRDYPGGNIHGGLVNLHGQWFVTYHRMTNDTIFSRRTCVERVTILPDGSIPEVEMTSLGFSTALDPYRRTPADIACVLTGGNMVTEFDPSTRAVVRNRAGSVIGYKTFDFGTVGASAVELQVRPSGSPGRIEVWAGLPGVRLGAVEVPGGRRAGWLRLRAPVSRVPGLHDVYLRFVGEGAGEIAQVRELRFVRGSESEDR